jgi:hypothetical protein
MATPRAILGPNDSAIQALAVKRTPTTENPNVTHMSMRKFLAAFSVFHPHLLQ